jgi:hypothetical protein
MGADECAQLTKRPRARGGDHRDWLARPRTAASPWTSGARTGTGVQERQTAPGDLDYRNGSGGEMVGAQGGEADHRGGGK